MTKKTYMIFPVIAYKKKDDKLYVFLQENELKTTSEELLYQKKVFDDVQFIDSNGTIFKILTLKRTGWGTVLMGYSLTRKGRLIKIDFELQDIGQMSIDEFKSFVIRVGRKYHSHFNEVANNIRHAESYAEIINFLK